MADDSVAVWQQLSGLRGTDLIDWRVSNVRNDASMEERNLDKLPMPFGWFMVAYSDELLVEEVKPLYYFGQDLALWRGEDGKPRMIGAFCKHLGAHMGYGGRVKGNSLECPFHAWEYNEEGAVTNVPYAKKIPPSAARPCKTQWHVTEKNKQILAWYHPFDEAPKWDVEEFDQVHDKDWTDFDKYEWIVHGPVQNMAENGVDAAHFKYIHGTASFPDYDIEFDGHKRTASVDAKMQTPKGEVDGTIAYGTVGAGQSWTKFSGISETLMVAGITPIDQARTHIRFAFTQPKEEAEGPMANLAKAMRKEICRQLDQDKVVWDRQKYMPKPSICDGDGPILPFRKFFAQFYAEWGDDGKNITKLKIDKKVS
ncbi:MAG: (2Fe-2S)-binding protein [Acidimicrobiales bacterium]|nr:Rieske 2Fe-2S domain-containing protein [Hyphomonadaceae bacterium]RZV39032.1 MAG: (2Fe-2S)-binding protein [Acidimicrobiales bacterium]